MDDSTSFQNKAYAMKTCHFQKQSFLQKIYITKRNAEAYSYSA